MTEIATGTDAQVWFAKIRQESGCVECIGTWLVEVDAEGTPTGELRVQHLGTWRKWEKLDDAQIVADLRAGHD